MAESSSFPVNIGRYQYRGKIGEGASAHVVKAYDPRINRELALKLLRSNLCQDEQYRDQFIREARAAGNLNHPNIVTVYDVGEVVGRPFIAMELLGGETLEEIQENNPLEDIEEILTIAQQVAAALKFSHANGIIHRDVKPANILYDRKRKRVKITDFGIARTPSKSMESSDLNWIMGTPEYMAPEQILGTETDARADIYSVGVLLYALVTRSLPFSADTPTELFQTVIEAPCRTFKSALEELPDALQPLILKCLSKNPNDRVQSAAELLEFIEDILDQVRREKSDSNKRIIPLKARWAAISVLVVAGVMTLGLKVIDVVQQDAISKLVLDYGESLAIMIAVESAEPLLIEDHIAVQSFVEDLRERNAVDSLTVTDRNGVVRGSDETARLGKKYIPPSGMHDAKQQGDLHISSIEHTNVGPIFYFVAPVNFQHKTVGHIYLGLSRSSLQKVSVITQAMLLGLLVVTIIAVVVVIYLLANRMTKPLRSLQRALDKITVGNFDARLEVRRNDELSMVYRAYNRMVEQLSKNINEKNPP